MTIPRILAIAGSDSGGGAGIQADIKTITMLGGHAMTAVTAITAQNTQGVTGIMAVPAEMVLAQIDAVVSDIGVDAIKIGMIGSADTGEVLARTLPSSAYPAEDMTGRIAEGGLPIIFDPVMIATSGAVLAGQTAIAAFERLIAVATLVTPNAPELSALTGVAVESEQQLEAAARLLADRYGSAVLAKGGHLPGATVVDLLVRPRGIVTRWSGSRVETLHHHGTGCTLSSAIATLLGKGVSLEAAIDHARVFVRAALENAPGLGAGHGPLGHGLGRTHFAPADAE